MVPDIEGGMTRHYPSNEVMSIYDAAMRYQATRIPLVIIAGKEYGTGSSRDWAAKGPKLLGVCAVLAESFERIHRSNLIGMGILPLQFKDDMTRKTLNLSGTEVINIINLHDNIKPGADINVVIQRADSSQIEVSLLSRIDTQNEIEYYRNGGILQYVLRNMLKKHKY
jgi:aconitate hydratase